MEGLHEEWRGRDRGRINRDSRMEKERETERMVGLGRRKTKTKKRVERPMYIEGWILSSNIRFINLDV